MKLVALCGRRPDAVWGRCAIPVGEALVTFAPEGVLWLSFGESPKAEAELAEFWRGGSLVRDDAATQKLADRIFEAGARAADAQDASASACAVQAVRPGRDECSAQSASAQATVATDESTSGDINLLVEGTPFQIKVWQALMEVPRGERITYSELARRAGIPRAVRAAATAIGRNNISYLIPCHRIVPAVGGVGQYRWGPEVKRALLEWERVTSVGADL